jgi:hypothetical protein
MDTKLEGEAEEPASELNVSVIMLEPVSYLSRKSTAVTDVDVEACNAEYQRRMGMTSLDTGILETSLLLLSNISEGDVSEVSSCSRQSLVREDSASQHSDDLERLGALVHPAISEQPVSLQTLATVFERDAEVIASVDDLAGGTAESGEMLSRREEEEAESVWSGASRAEALAVTLAEPLFLTVAKEAVGKIDDTGTNAFSFILRVEYGSSGTFTKMIFEEGDEPGQTSIQQLILQIIAELGEEGIVVQGTINLRIQNDDATFAKQQAATTALVRSGIPYKGEVILHPREGERWQKSRWGVKAKTMRAQPPTRGRQGSAGGEQKEQARSPWRPQPPGRCSSLLWQLKMPQARDSINRAGRLNLGSITPDGSCLWQCLALATDPSMSIEEMDLHKVYRQTLTAYERLMDPATSTSLPSTHPCLMLIWEADKRVKQLKKQGAVGEYQDVVALAWHLGIRVVMWVWNVAEGAFERTVQIVDFRPPRGPGIDVRDSICSTMYLLYANNGASYKEGVNNHFELLYPVKDAELKHLNEHFRERHENVEDLFRTNRWVCAEDLVLEWSTPVVVAVINESSEGQGTPMSSGEVVSAQEAMEIATQDEAEQEM